MSNKIIVLAATELEMASCRDVEGCEFVVTGMGATNTALATMYAVERYKPELVVQIGIAGAIDRNLQIGEAYFVCSDYQADLGAWRDNNFVPFEQRVYFNSNQTVLPEVSARSVMTACDDRLTEDASVQVESMEGAAFFQAMSYFQGVRFAQIRSISNYIDTPRSLWRISDAIKILPVALRYIILER